MATVSHELRTPLTSIYGFAETLLREDASFGEEDRASFVRYIASEAERLNRLVDGLLSAARLETGAVGLTLAPVDVARGRARCRPVGRRPLRAAQARARAAAGRRARRGRRRPRAPGADQPDRQRHQVLARRRHRDGARAQAPPRRRAARLGRGHRHLRARPAQPLPEVLPRRRRDVARHPRHRARPLPRARLRDARWAAASGSSRSRARARRSSSSCPRARRPRRRRSAARSPDAGRAHPRRRRRARDPPALPRQPAGRGLRRPGGAPTASPRCASRASGTPS